MGFNNKALLIGAAGAATLAFVGVGAGAVFNDTATASSTVGTGTVKMVLGTNSQCCGLISSGPGANGNKDIEYRSDGNWYHWDFTSAPDQTAGAPSGDNSIALSPLSNIGSDFNADMELTLTNTGTNPINYANFSVTDGLTGTPTATDIQLEKDTLVSLDVDNGGVVYQAGAETLYNLLTNGATFAVNRATGNTVSSKLAPLAPGQTEGLRIDLAPNTTGGSEYWQYNNADEGGTMAPTFSVTGADTTP